MLNIGWFSTGRDKAARQLLQIVQENIHSGKITGKIKFVFSNREYGEAGESDLFFELVRGYSIPLICLSDKKTRGSLRDKETWRITYDSEIDNRIKKFPVDVCLLAGYMLIVGARLCKKYNMINLHPALPGGPVGSWQEVIRELIQLKSDEGGAMMHLVTPELDRGPAISYCAFSIKSQPFEVFWQNNDSDTLFQLIREYELKRELPLIILTLQALSRGEINIRDGKAIDAQGKLINVYDFSDKVEKALIERSE